MDWEQAATNISKHLPSGIIDIMNTLATVWGESCFLGGGAVRDLLLGNEKQIRDWDFYFPQEAEGDRKAVLLLKKLFPTMRIWVEIPWTSTLDKEHEYDDRWLVVKGFEAGTSYDFIFSGQKIEHFDHAICQCSLNCKTYQLETTEWFDWCADKQVHKIFRKNLDPRTTNKSILDHTPRILRKYPWPVLIDYGGYHVAD